MKYLFHELIFPSPFYHRIPRRLRYKINIPPICIKRVASIFILIIRTAKEWNPLPESVLCCCEEYIIGVFKSGEN